MRKKFLVQSILACMMLSILSGCESNSDTSTEKTKINSTTQETQKTSTEKPKSSKEIAEKYIGDTLENLTAEIGEYSDFSKAESCYYEGEYDGIAQFDNFTVYCHSEGKTTWYIDSVE